METVAILIEMKTPISIPEENKTADITKILNEVYEDNDSSVDKGLYKMQLIGLDKEDW